MAFAAMTGGGEDDPPGFEVVVLLLALQLTRYSPADRINRDKAAEPMGLRSRYLNGILRQ